MKDNSNIYPCFCAIIDCDIALSSYRICLNCNEKICEYCIEDKYCKCGGIEEKGKYKHIYVSKSEIQFEMCRNHLEYQCHFYCYDCKYYVCILCKSDSSHNSHKVVLIDSYIKMQKNNINTQRTNLEKMTKFLQDKEKELKEKKESILKYKEKLLQKTTLNTVNFSKIVGEVVNEKKMQIHNESLREIIDLKNELINRKRELEIRKNFNIHFNGFILGMNIIYLI